MGRTYERHTAQIEGDFVVFVLGARLAKPWLFWKMIPVGRAMQAMLAELAAHPELGCLGHERFGSVQIQYWRSREHLMEYARNKDGAHLPAWREFNRLTAKSGAVGIWHETFCVRAGEYECLYGNMPPIGLGRFAKRVSISGRAETARGRLGVTDGTDTPEGAELGE